MSTMTSAMPPIDDNIVRYLMTHVLRDEIVFNQALARLKPEYFQKSSEQHWMAIWVCAADYYKQYKRLPNFEALNVASANYSASRLGVDLSNAISQALAYVFQFPSDQLDKELALDYLKSFLYERIIGVQLYNAVLHLQNRSCLNYAELVEKLEHDAKYINQIQQKELNIDGFADPETWEVQHIDRMRTGVQVIDYFITSGIPRSSIYTLLGPTGVGKSLLAIQTAVSLAKSQPVLEVLNKSPGMVLYFTRELDLNTVRLRAASCAAHVPFSRLCAVKSWSELSKRDNLAEYEIEKYENTPSEERLGEQERLESVRPWLAKYLKIIDFSGSPYSVGGMGGIPEMRAYADMIQDKYQMPICHIIDDWAGMCVRRKLEATYGNYDKLTLMLSGYLDSCYNALSGPFNTPVMVVQQLKGEVNSWPPEKTPNHGHAEWCSSFAVNAWYALVLGTKDKVTNTCFLDCTKTRDGASKEKLLCYIDGDYCKFEDATNRFYIDPYTKKVKARSHRQDVDFSHRYGKHAAPSPFV